MKGTFINTSLSIILLMAIAGVGCKSSHDKTELSQNNNNANTAAQLNPQEEEIKATIDALLFAAGNYNIEALDSMISDKAMLGISGMKDSIWSNSEIAIHEYFKSVEEGVRSPYCEIPSNYDIMVTEGRIALVRANCILYRWGVPQTQEINHFTLIRENQKWKILNISWTKVDLPEDKKEFELDMFARGYAQAWCSQRPNFVASFFAEDGELTVNNRPPAAGTEAITNVAKGFMEAFSDLTVSLDSLTTSTEKTRFYWTLTGTNDGSNGTGNKVKVSGFEEWTLNNEGLIQESKGYFDSQEYERQLAFGMDEK